MFTAVQYVTWQCMFTTVQLQYDLGVYVYCSTAPLNVLKERLLMNHLVDIIFSTHSGMGCLPDAASDHCQCNVLYNIICNIIFFFFF